MYGESTYLSNTISDKFSPHRKTLTFAGYQSDELLLHYSTTTDLSIAPCSLLSILKSHPPLQSIQTLNPMTKFCYKLISKHHLKHIPCCILCNIHHNQLNIAASSHTHTSAADLKNLEQIHSLPLVTLFIELRVEKIYLLNIWRATEKDVQVCKYFGKDHLKPLP